MTIPLNGNPNQPWGIINADITPYAPDAQSIRRTATGQISYTMPDGSIIMQLPDGEVRRLKFGRDGRTLQYNVQLQKGDPARKDQQFQYGPLPRKPVDMGRGNTQGLIYPQTDPLTLATITVTAQAEPKKKKDDDDDGGFWSTVGAVAHGGLAVVSFLPGPLGMAAASADSVLYLAQGDVEDAAISALGLIPGEKLVAGAVKLGKAARGVAKAEGAAKAVKAAKAAEEAEEAEQAAKVAKEAEQAEKASREADDVAKAEDEGGHVEKKDKPKKEPHKDCGKIVKYNDRTSLKGSGLQKDHTASAAALKRAAERRIQELRDSGEAISENQVKKILGAIVNHAPTIGIPPGVHRQGNTYGGKNTSARISADARDLNAAAKRDTDAIAKAMGKSDQGCKEGYVKAAKVILDIDWNKYVDDAIQMIIGENE